MKQTQKKLRNNTKLTISNKSGLKKCQAQPNRIASQNT